MDLKGYICALATLAAAVAEAKGIEYECDDGRSDSGYRIRVLELSRDVQEIIVLKKSNGSAKMVENKKLKRIGGPASAPEYAFTKTGHRVSFKKTAADSDGNWVGTFTLSGKGGAHTVRASCGRVETLTM